VNILCLFYLCLVSAWIVSFLFESTQKVSDFEWIDSLCIWIDSSLNRIIPSWVVSSNSLTLSKSIQNYLESIQTSIWATWIVSCISWLASISIDFPSSGFNLFMYESIQKLNESIQSMVFVRKFSLITSPYK